LSSGMRRSVALRSVFQLLVTVNVVPTSPILCTLVMDAIRSPETSVLTTATRCNIPKDDILHTGCCCLKVGLCKFLPIN
jgi:hypothetical protein